MTKPAKDPWKEAYFKAMDHIRSHAYHSDDKFTRIVCSECWNILEVHMPKPKTRKKK